MDASNTLASLLLAGVLMGLMSTSYAYDFYVGGKDGWVLNPSESYNNWAERMRFQVNDKLVFKYKKGEDSVLVVKKEDYDSCNVNNPIQKLDGGDSVFQFDRSGPFFFISGAPGRCAKGQKLIVVVLAVRNKKPSPTPTSSPPSVSPSTPPSHNPPISSPSPSPSSSYPSPSTSPVSSPIPSPSPSSSPVSSPSPSSTPIESPPAFSPSPTTTGTSVPSPSESELSPNKPPNSGSGTEYSPAPSPSSPDSSSSVLIVSSFSLGMVALVLGSVILS